MRFYRIACGKKIIVNAFQIGFGTSLLKNNKVFASEYQWVITRPDWYTYVMDDKPFRKIYQPLNP